MTSISGSVEDTGEDGYVQGKMGYSPLVEMRVNWLGVERFALDQFDRPDLFFSLYETIRKGQREQFELVADSPAELVVYCGNVSPEVFGRERFERYILPCYNELGEMLHAKGKLFGTHADANNAIWKDLLATSTLDVIEAFTPAPDTDMSLAQAYATWPGKALWINYPSSGHLGTREQIREQTRDLLHQAGEARGLILGITEDVPADKWRMSLDAIADVLAENKASSRGLY